MVPRKRKKYIAKIEAEIKILEKKADACRENMKGLNSMKPEWDSKVEELNIISEKIHLFKKQIRIMKYHGNFYGTPELMSEIHFNGHDTTFD